MSSTVLPLRHSHDLHEKCRQPEGLVPCQLNDICQSWQSVVAMQLEAGFAAFDSFPTDDALQ